MFFGFAHLQTRSEGPSTERTPCETRLRPICLPRRAERRLDHDPDRRTPPDKPRALGPSRQQRSVHPCILTILEAVIHLSRVRARILINTIRKAAIKPVLSDLRVNTVGVDAVCFDRAASDVSVAVDLDTNIHPYRRQIHAGYGTNVASRILVIDGIIVSINVKSYITAIEANVVPRRPAASACVVVSLAETGESAVFTHPCGRWRAKPAYDGA